jgi:hypothetical protein
MKCGAGSIFDGGRDFGLCMGQFSIVKNLNIHRFAGSSGLENQQRHAD